MGWGEEGGNDGARGVYHDCGRATPEAPASWTWLRAALVTSSAYLTSKAAGEGARKATVEGTNAKVIAATRNTWPLLELLLGRCSILSLTEGMYITFQSVRGLVGKGTVGQENSLLASSYMSPVTVLLLLVSSSSLLVPQGTRV